MSRKIIIFSGSRAVLPSLKSVVESDLMELHLRSHVVQCDGECFSEEKEFYLKLLNGKLGGDTINCCALIATSGVGNSGIDDCNLTCIIGHRIPPNVLERYQELGRCGCHSVIEGVFDEYALMHANQLGHRST